MQFDHEAKWWSLRCLAIGVLITVLYGTIPLIPKMDRAVHTLLGLIGGFGIIFCGALPWIKKAPNWFKRNFYCFFNNAHPWVGLLSAWAVILHTDFRMWPTYWNISKVLYLSFFTVVISGMIALVFRQFQIMKKDAKGSSKKEMAGYLMDIGYTWPLKVHDQLTYALYPLLLLHIYGYAYYGRFW